MQRMQQRIILQELRRLRKFNSTIKLCVRTDKDIGPMTMDEQVKIVKKAIKDRKFYLESINKSEKV